MQKKVDLTRDSDGHVILKGVYGIKNRLDKSR